MDWLPIFLLLKVFYSPSLMLTTLQTVLPGGALRPKIVAKQMYSIYNAAEGSIRLHLARLVLLDMLPNTVQECFHCLTSTKWYPAATHEPSIGHGNL